MRRLGRVRLPVERREETGPHEDRLRTLGHLDRDERRVRRYEPHHAVARGGGRGEVRDAARGSDLVRLGADLDRVACGERADRLEAVGHVGGHGATRSAESVGQSE